MKKQNDGDTPIQVFIGGVFLGSMTMGLMIFALAQYLRIHP